MNENSNFKGTILVIEDDQKQAGILKNYFQSKDYSSILAHTGRDGLELFRKREIDLIILDLMLPGIDGLKVCKSIRERSEVPIIILTAKTAEEDRVKGLNFGADDYVTKPFSLDELMARVQAVLRRVEEEGPAELTFGPLTINLNREEALLNDAPIDLRPAEFKLLSVMAQQAGHPFSRSQLIHSAFGYEYEGFDRTVDAHVKNLRKEIEPDPSNPTYIKTVYGVGYKFDPEAIHDKA